VVPAESGAALYIAQERGLFAARGLHVKIETITSSIAAIPFMLHGSIDIASGQITSFISAEAGGIGRFHVLAAGLALRPGVNQIVAPKSSGIASVAQLKGKKIAVNTLTGDDALLIDSVLARSGISPRQLTPVVTPFPDMGTAVAAGRVDAAYCTEPFCTELKEQHRAEVVADTDQGAARSMLISGYTVTSAWMSKYPRTGAAFASAIAAASKIADTDPATLRHALMVSLRIAPRVADVMGTGTFLTRLKPAELQQVANLMLRYHELKHSFSVTALTRS
jgi:NitT/TauT family transport system substrate-binding protein